LLLWDIYISLPTGMEGSWSFQGEGSQAGVLVREVEVNMADKRPWHPRLGALGNSQVAPELLWREMTAL
jgi:hypothetical protein